MSKCPKITCQIVSCTRTNRRLIYRFECGVIWEVNVDRSSWAARSVNLWITCIQWKRKWEHSLAERCSAGVMLTVSIDEPRGPARDNRHLGSTYNCYVTYSVSVLGCLTDWTNPYQVRIIWHWQFELCSCGSQLVQYQVTIIKYEQGAESGTARLSYTAFVYAVVLRKSPVQPTLYRSKTEEMNPSW